LKKNVGRQWNWGLRMMRFKASYQSRSSTDSSP
jgi:hypothetical protein